MIAARSYRLPHGYTGVPIAGEGQAEDYPAAVIPDEASVVMSYDERGQKERERWIWALGSAMGFLLGAGVVLWWKT